MLNVPLFVTLSSETNLKHQLGRLNRCEKCVLQDGDCAPEESCAMFSTDTEVPFGVHIVNPERDDIEVPAWAKTAGIQIAFNPGRIYGPSLRGLPRTAQHIARVREISQHSAAA